MVTFTLTVRPSFWDQRRRWPAGCRPVIFSVSLVNQNTGGLSVPAAHAQAVERLLRAHPDVILIERVSASPAVPSDTV
jgi:hypothetical protein